MTRMILVALSLAIAVACTKAGPGRVATLTGCLERGEALDSYVLRMPAVGEQTRGTSGGSSSGDWGEARVYRVDPNNTNVDLGQFVGKRVTINGRVEEAVLVDRPVGTSGETSQGSTASIFHASTIRPVGDTCQ